MAAAAEREETFWKHEVLHISALRQLNINSYKHTLNKLAQRSCQ
jgi:hypothetical protein